MNISANQCAAFFTRRLATRRSNDTVVATTRVDMPICLDLRGRNALRGARRASRSDAFTDAANRIVAKRLVMNKREANVRDDAREA